MASSKEYLSYILEQLSEVDGITYRQMMGEYIIYRHGKITAYICDNRLLVKPVPGAIKMMPKAEPQPPYEGAKDMLPVDNSEDRDFLKSLFDAIYPELPTPKEKKSIRIKKLNKKEIPAALDLVWRVFSEFEAPEYSDDGIEEFRKSLDNPDFISKMRFYGAFDGADIVGVLAMRAPQHISLLFVNAAYHRKGIAKKLFCRMRKDYEKQLFTVNSSPYAVEAYHRLGFRDTGTEQVKNGIRFTPMEFTDKNYG